MANIVWSGNQVSRPYTSLVEVTATGTVGTVTATINSKTETYTATAADTTVAITAANAAAAFAASPIPEFRLVTWTSPDDGFILATGPSDGRPVAVTFGRSGSCTLGTPATVAATSAHDASDAANYVGGVAPANGDVAVFEGDAPDVRYDLDQFASNTVGIDWRPSYTGSVGLADRNPLGFPEYLPTRFETAGTSLKLRSGGGGTGRFDVTGAGGAVTVTCTGTGPAETYEVTGLPSSSVVDANNCGVVVSPLAADVSALGTARVANNAGLRCGTGVTTTTATVKQATATFNAAVATLNADLNSDIVVDQAGATTNLNIAGGTVRWRSTGATGTVVIGSNGLLDLTEAPGSVATSGITVNSGGGINDPYKRMASYTLAGDDWLDARANINIGTAFSVTVS